MDARNENFEIMKAKWILLDQVSEMKGKTHLRQKDKDSYIERSNQITTWNDQVIASLRRSNKAKRILLAHHENGDKSVIETVFQDDRTDRLSLQRFTAFEAINEMDQIVCEREKFLNAMNYERETREQKLIELEQELERMYHMEKKTPDTKESEITATKLENMLDKALIKYDTARNITTSYADILSKLKEESLTLPAKLDTAELSLRQQKTELRELKALSKEAFNARDQSKADLSVVEQVAYETRKQREADLNATRKEVERRKAEADKVDKKAARAALLVDQTDQGALMETQKKLEKQNRVLLYEDAMERIQMASHVTDIADVVKRIESQKKTQEKLQSRVQELESQKNRKKSELEKLKKEYHDMKYTGELKLSRSQAKVEGMAEYTNKMTKSHEDNLQSLERNGRILMGIRTGAATLLEKLNPVKLRPPNHNHTDGDVYDQLELCSKKLRQLMKEVGKSGDITVPRASMHTIQTPDFQEFLETQFTTDNVRVKLQESETELVDFGFEEQENVVLSRNDVKNLGQKLIDSKQKKKKKSKKA